MRRPPATRVKGWCLMGPTGTLYNSTFECYRWGAEVRAYEYIAARKMPWMEKHPTRYWKDAEGFEQARTRHGWRIVKAWQTVSIRVEK